MERPNAAAEGLVDIIPLQRVCEKDPHLAVKPPGHQVPPTLRHHHRLGQQQSTVTPFSSTRHSQSKHSAKIQDDCCAEILKPKKLFRMNVLAHTASSSVDIGLCLCPKLSRTHLTSHRHINAPSVSISSKILYGGFNTRR